MNTYRFMIYFKNGDIEKHTVIARSLKEARKMISNLFYISPERVVHLSA